MLQALAVEIYMTKRLLLQGGFLVFSGWDLKVPGTFSGGKPTVLLNKTFGSVGELLSPPFSLLSRKMSVESKTPVYCAM